MAGRPTFARPTSLIATCDQWVRATHVNTAVDGRDGVLSLSWSEPEIADGDGDAGGNGDGERCPARGLAIDRLCRLYRLWRHGVSRQIVGSTAEGVDYSALPEAVPLVGNPGPDPTPTTQTSSQSGSGPGAEPQAGPDFSTKDAPEPVIDGAGITVDDADRLYVSDAGNGTVAVLDLWSRRLLRVISIASPRHRNRRPAGLTSDGRRVWIAVQNPAGVLVLSAGRSPVELALPATVEPTEGEAPPIVTVPEGFEPTRIALLRDATPVLLFHSTATTDAVQPSASADAWLVAGDREPINVGPASDVLVNHVEPSNALGTVVVAPCGDAARPVLRRFTATPDGWIRATPLDASGYDGGGIALTREGRIIYSTPDGFRLAVAGAVNYAADGHCITYRLDSGEPLNHWGRLFVDACIPDGTTIHVGAITSDDDFETAIPHTSPDPAGCVPFHANTDLVLPSPLQTGTNPEETVGPLHRRGRSPLPWLRPEAGVDTFEAPVLAPPGRYLWLTIRLRGNTRRTPRVHELRVEHRAHTLLRRLPAVYSDDTDRADFLHRYLATFDGMLNDLELRSRCRDILIDPHGAPGEALEWLASFFGLTLDDRWAEAAKRQLISEIVELYRRRGTLWALARYIEIFLAGDQADDQPQLTPKPIILEHYRLRGLGGPLVGNDPVTSSRSVVGHGFRVGGAVDRTESTPLDSSRSLDDAFSTNAHRFTVLIPTPLGSEAHAAIRHVLDTERPAHTTYELCTVDAGLRAGVASHVGVSTIVGPTGGFEGAVTDRSLIGRGALLGGPTTGVAVEASRVGHDARVG